MTPRDTSDTCADVHRPQIPSLDQRRFGGAANVADADVGRELAQDQAVLGDVDDGEIGDDPLYAALSGQRQRALIRRSWVCRPWRRAPSSR